MLGWCSTGMHEGKELEWGTPCPGKYERIIVEKKKVVRLEMVYCDCKCHETAG